LHKGEEIERIGNDLEDPIEPGDVSSAVDDDTTCNRILIDDVLDGEMIDRGIVNDEILDDEQELQEA
jgi:hypothetical protein